MQKTISIVDGIARLEKWRMAEPVNFELLANENIAITGSNGGGKSMLVDILTGAHPLYSGMIDYYFGTGNSYSAADNIKYICFKDMYGGDSDKSYFLQQRWNQTEIDDKTLTVKERLEEAYTATGNDDEKRRLLKEKITSLFGLHDMLDKYVVLLSSGELRKLTIASAIFSQPKLLIIDNPFIGLDARSRMQLTELLRNIENGHEMQIMMVVKRIDDIPDFITHVVEVESMKVGRKMTRHEYLEYANRKNKEADIRRNDERNKIRHLLQEIAELHGELHESDVSPETERMVVEMNDISIRYGKHDILSHLTWNVKEGEHWALTGENGSGKSTLLSLVCADNPQSYACDIALFGRKRGSGESIWDIKRRIGYVSPEMHRAFRTNVSIEQVVASGFCNAMGIYRKPNMQQLLMCRQWMKIVGIENTEGKKFFELSSGEQRLALLARAFVKNPQLLILDEPLHGLDDENREHIKMVVDEYCKQRSKTLIMVSHYYDEFPECIDHQLSLVKS